MFTNVLVSNCCALGQAGAPEAAVTKPGWIGIGTANHNVVEQLDVKGAGRFSKLEERSEARTPWRV